MKVDLKKLVLIMGSLWTSVINLLLFLVPVIKIYKTLLMGYQFDKWNDLLSGNAGQSVYLVVSNYVTFGIFVFTLVFTIFFALVSIGKIKSNKLASLPSGIISLVLTLVSFISVINEIISMFVFISYTNQYNTISRCSAGLWIILGVDALFLFILIYSFFKFDEMSPMINSYEHEFIDKKIAKKKAQKKASAVPGNDNNKEEVHLNREQRRKQNKK